MWHMNLKYIKRQSIWKHIQLTHCCYMNNYQYTTYSITLMCEVISVVYYYLSLVITRIDNPQSTKHYNGQK